MRLPFMLTTGDNVVVEAGAKLEMVVIKKNGNVTVDELVVGEDTVIGRFRGEGEKKGLWYCSSLTKHVG